MNGNSALVTGGAGFVGSHLCERLLEHGWEVWALDDLSTGSQDNVRHLLGHAGFHLVVDSVTSQHVVNELVNRCDVVYHLAAAVGVRLIVERPVETIVTNVKGTENVLENCHRFGKPVLIASTSEVYGDHDGRELSEDARRLYGPTTERRWAYAASKAVDEFLALAYQQELGQECVIVRMFNTVGPRQSGEWGMVLPRFVRAALRGEPIEVYGDGTQTRCFLHVDDAARALSWLMVTPGCSGQIFNVGNAQEQISIGELAQLVRLKADSQSRIVFVPYSKVYGLGIEDMSDRRPSTEKIERAVEWKPEKSLDDVVEDVIAHELALSDRVDAYGTSEADRRKASGAR